MEDEEDDFAPIIAPSQAHAIKELLYCCRNYSWCDGKKIRHIKLNRKVIAYFLNPPFPGDTDLNTLMLLLYKKAQCDLGTGLEYIHKLDWDSEY